MSLHDIGIPTYEQVRDGILKLMDEGKISREDAALVLPELAESEDERIRKAIGAAICGTTATSILEANGTNLPDALAYLEKHKEGNLVEKRYIQEAFNKGMQAGMKQKPAEWSKEDEIMFCNLLSFLEGRVGLLPKGQKKYSDWMKTRFKYAFPLPHWKPSEEQMVSLGYVLKEYESAQIHLHESAAKQIYSLYEDLKKL